MYVCSGQSNMEVPLSKVFNGTAEAAAGTGTVPPALPWLELCPYVLYGVKYIDLVSLNGTAEAAAGTGTVPPDIPLCIPIFPIVFPYMNFRLYAVVSLHMCVLPYQIHVPTTVMIDQITVGSP